VSLGGGLGLRFAVPVGGREDAEGDRDAGFKVQVDDFSGARECFSYNLPRARKEDKKDPLALVPKETKVGRRRERKERERPLCYLFFRLFGDGLGP